MKMNSSARRLFTHLFSFVLLALALPSCRPALAQTRHLDWNDYAKITSVSDPQISPDGKTIVFVVSRPNLEQDRSDRELVHLAGLRAAIASGLSQPMDLEKTRLRRYSSSQWPAAKPVKLPRRQTASSSLPGGPAGKKSHTSPPTSPPTRKKSKSITMLSRSATTISSRPKPLCHLTSGFFRQRVEKQNG
jgi:hypothetical protein